MFYAYSYESFRKLLANMKPRNPINSVPIAVWQLAKKRPTISENAVYGPNELFKLYDIAVSMPSIALSE